MEFGFRGEYQSKPAAVLLYREGDEDPAIIYLANIFLKAKSLPRGERDGMIRDFLAKVLSEAEGLDPDQLVASLALRVRTPFELALRRSVLDMHPGQTPEPVIVEMGQGLLLELVSDGDNAVSMVGKDQLEEAGLQEADAIKIARANLARASEEPAWLSVGDNTWQSGYDDDYDFARLVAAGAEAKLPGDGKLIGFAPSHSVFFVTAAETPEAIEAMVEHASAQAQNHRPFCQLLWEWDGHAWREWMPGADHPAQGAAALQRARETMSIRHEQKNYLEESCQRAGQDVYIGNFQYMEDDGGLQSWCAYTINVPSVLPQTDVVAIAEIDSAGSANLLGMMPWQAFVTALGDLSGWPMPGDQPAWFSLENELSPDQVDAIRKGVVPASS